MTTDNDHSMLSAFVRNHFFYGKLMDVDQFEKEQNYGLAKRALMNRLMLGCGVVCGLNVVKDPESENRILILPGVAIDGCGHEIVFPEKVSVDPHQLTDNEGRPTGEPIQSGLVEICLAFKEVKTDPVPVLVPDCDRTGDNCAHSSIKEGFCILVRNAENDSSAPPTCALGEIPLSANGDLHDLVCRRISEACSETGEETCVALARVEVSLNDTSIDSCTNRKLVYSNALLHELILCLVDRIGQFAQGRFLRYANGDRQIGPPGGQLGEPLTIEILDAEGKPTPDILVQFEVPAGSGSVAPETAKTKADGSAQTQWTLGPDVGEQQIVVSAIGTPFTVTFRAVAHRVEDDWHKWENT